MTILFAGRTLSDFIFAVCWVKGWMGLWKRWLEDTMYWACHFQAEAQAPDAKLAWCGDQPPLVLVIAQKVHWDKKGVFLVPNIFLWTESSQLSLFKGRFSQPFCVSASLTALLFQFPFFLSCHFSHWLEYVVYYLVSQNSHILFVPLCKSECIIRKLLSWWFFCPVIPVTDSTH